MNGRRATNGNERSNCTDYLHHTDCIVNYQPQEREKIMEAREQIIEMLKPINRPGMEGLIEWMEYHGFYDAPCSSKHHLAKPGGLAEHSLNVCRIACSLVEAFFVKEGKPFSQSFLDSVVICALLHDLGKAGQFGKPNYIQKPIAAIPLGGFYEPFIYETNKDLLYVPHEIRSVAIASRFIELTEEEQFAILYHNGLYGELKGFKGNETPLLMILHFADMWAVRVVESEDSN